MKRNLFIMILIVLFSAASCFAKSRIVFEKTVHDFGKVSKESAVKYTFNFQNSGKSMLIIERIKTG